MDLETLAHHTTPSWCCRWPHHTQMEQRAPQQRAAQRRAPTATPGRRPVGHHNTALPQTTIAPQHHRMPTSHPAAFCYVSCDARGPSNEQEPRPPPLLRSRGPMARLAYPLWWFWASGSTPTRRHAAFACAQTHAYSVVMIPKTSHRQTEASCRSWLFTEPACWRAAKWTGFAAIWPFAGHATRAAHRRNAMLRLRARKRTRIPLS